MLDTVLDWKIARTAMMAALRRGDAVKMQGRIDEMLEQRKPSAESQ